MSPGRSGRAPAFLSMVSAYAPVLSLPCTSNRMAVWHPEMSGKVTHGWIGNKVALGHELVGFPSQLSRQSWGNRTCLPSKSETAMPHEEIIDFAIQYNAVAWNASICQTKQSGIWPSWRWKPTRDCNLQDRNLATRQAHCQPPMLCITYICSAAMRRRT